MCVHSNLPESLIHFRGIEGDEWTEWRNESLVYDRKDWRYMFKKKTQSQGRKSQGRERDLCKTQKLTRKHTHLYN